MKLLINIDSRDKSKQGILASLLQPYGFQAKVIYGEQTYTEMLEKARGIGADAVICACERTLKNLVAGKGIIGDWRGSVLRTNPPILITNPLMNILSVKSGKWLMEQDLRKLPAIARKDYQFQYEYEIIENLIDAVRVEKICAEADCLVVDIETTRDNYISSLSFTCIKDSKIGATFVIETIGKPIEWHQIIKNILANPVVKAFHNGAFDCYQLLRFQIPVNNYLLDTEYFWKWWHAELEKSLAFVSSVLLPDYIYWKEEVKDDPLGYNAKDTINTARCLLAMMSQAPKWVWGNYAKLFPLVFPAIGYGFEGIKVQEDQLEPVRVEAKREVDGIKERLRVMSDWEAFNPASPQQVATLLYKIVGAVKPKRCKSKGGTDEVTLKKLRLQHPLVQLFVDEILRFRKESKALSTYYSAELLGDRLLYSVKIDGTETGRQSSSKCPLWVPLPEGSKALSKQKNYGAQVQNIPKYFKGVLVPDEGYTIGEADKSQSEARCVAYQSGDAGLIEALEGEEDFYCNTAWRFFGTRINKEDPIRQITKKIIHGTNYIMGEDTFIDSVGIPEMIAAMNLLDWRGPSLKQFAGHLLSLYHTAYPGVQKGWKSIKSEVAATGHLKTEDGWVREVFGNVMKDASVWRRCVAHKPQHLSVAGLNKALIQIFFKLQLGSKGALRVKAQVHDSCLFQALTPRFDYYAQAIKEELSKPTRYKKKNGEIGEFTIPIDVEYSTKSWKEKKKWLAQKSIV